MNFGISGRGFIRSWVLMAIGILIATHTCSGIHADSVTTLVIVVVVLNFLNLILKPLLVFFTLPFVVFSFGLGIWIINAFLFLLVGKLVEGFVVESFWYALWGAFVVNMSSMFGNIFLSRKNKQTSCKADDDVIDM